MSKEEMILSWPRSSERRHTLEKFETIDRPRQAEGRGFKRPNAFTSSGMLKDDSVKI